jgi:hypothetical protein
MTAHRGDYTKYKNGNKGKVMSFDLFDKYGIENCDIVLLELVEAYSKDELHTRDAHYIKTIKCVNKCILKRTQQEYREDHKETITIQLKQWRQDNKEKIKQYYTINKEKIKQYQEDRKDQINERRKEQVVCQCGSIYSVSNKSRHEMTKKQIEFIRCLPSSSDPVSEVV